MKTFISHTLVLLSLGFAGCSSPNLHPDLTADPNVMVRQWTIPTSEEFAAGDRGYEYSNPVVYENTLIFGSRNEGVVSLYSALNQVRWRFPVKNGVISELAVENESVYFGGGDGALYSLNTNTGKLNWKYEIRNPAISKPIIHNGKLYVTTSDDVVYAFESGSGQWIWSYRRRAAAPSTILGASAPLIVGDDVYAGTSDGFLVSLAAKDGRLRWERRLHADGKFQDVDAQPTMYDGVLYLPSYDGALYALNPKKAGEVIWKFEAGGSKQILIQGDRIYLPSSDGFIYALNRSNSKVIWKFEMDGGTPTRLILADGYLIAGSSHRYLYALDVQSGRPVFRFDAGYGSGFSGSPAWEEKRRRVYILSGAGNLYSFLLRSRDRKAWPLGRTDGYTF